ncbi:MAG: FAD-binding oxidoreductase [Gammaproteobacteria bacterium]
MASEPHFRTTPATLDRLKAAVGANGWIDDAQEMQAYVVDQRQRYHGRAPIVLRPDSTAQVSAVVKICHESGLGVVAQGGNTGLVGGSVPDQTGQQIVVSLARMDRVREVDVSNATMTVEAGRVLAEAQRSADEAGLLFPLSLAAEGSCQIGGNLSTNAGGTAVLRYGNARDLVLGLEVVLANGEVWDGLRGLRKDNTGYDIKQLFLGSEGTLGIITAAVLKLFPKPTQSQTVFAAVENPQAATQLLMELRAATADSVTTFEYIDRQCLELVFDRIHGACNPLVNTYDHNILIELASGRDGDHLRDLAEEVIGGALERGDVLDATIAQSQSQSQALWYLREAIPVAARSLGAGIKHDVSVPVSRTPEFLGKAREIVASKHPQALVLAFGHLGDGNIHFNLGKPETMGAEDFYAPETAVHEAVYALTHSLGGSFSAEHGIGRMKREELKRYRCGVELELMRKLKKALDPAGTLNPGKVV